MSALKFFKYLIIAGCVLSLPRLIEAALYQEFLPSSSTFLMNIYMGLRFDLLTLSFFLLPVLLLILFLRLIQLQRITTCLPFLNLFTFGMWIFIAGVYFFNFLYLNVHQERVWKQDWNQAFLLLKTSSILEIIISFVGATFLLWSGFLVFKKIRKLFLSASVASLLGMFLILAFFARGSLAQDHLRRNHCDDRPNSVVRALCLNPVYVFSKIKNQEFEP